MSQPARTGLLRVIGRWDLVALAVNGVVGAGIFGLPSEVFRRIGAWSLLAFIACGVVVALIVLCFAEVSSRFSETGGPYLYAGEAFGPVVGFEVGWLMWIARLTAFAANTNLFIGYLGYFWPGAETPAIRAAVIVAVVVSLVTLNLLGVRNATTAGNLFTVAKLVPLLLFVTVGVFFLDGARFATTGPPPLDAFSASVLVLVYAFSGFEMATIAGGEVVEPERNVPRALLTAMTIVVLLYISIQVVAIGTLPTLGDSTRPLADAGATFLGPAGGALITAGALVSIFGTLIVVVMVGTRLPYAMAERGQLPRALARTHPQYRTPHVSILFTGAIMLVLTLSGTFVYTATISVIARLLSYAVTCAALPVLRRRTGAPPARFRTPGGLAIVIAALALVGWLLSHVTLAQGRDAALFILAGIVVYLIGSRRGGG